MGKEEKTTADRAAKKLQKEAETIKKTKGSGFAEVALRELAEPIASMLVRFVYQEEIFAEAVNKSDKKLYDCLEEIMKLESKEKPVISGLDAGNSAVQFYYPEAKVVMSMKIVIPIERDDDLFDLGTIDDDPEDGAIILELPMTD